MFRNLPVPDAEGKAAWSGMDPRGRRMLHPPWAAGREKSREYEEPALVLRRIILAFEDAGGSSEDLTALLNSHIPSERYRLERGDFDRDDLFFSLEYYFYLSQFCKILLGNRDFRYREGDRQLGDRHFITEKGSLSFRPWHSDGRRRDGYLSMSNIRAMFVYTEEEYRLPDDPDRTDSATEAGSGIAADVLTLINQMSEERFRIGREFIDKEEILVSFEYLFNVTALFQLLTNRLDFIDLSYRYGFLYNSLLAEAIFMKPGTSPGAGLRSWLERTNNNYDLQIREGSRRIEILVDTSRQRGTGMFDIYREVCLLGIRQAVPAVWHSFMEMSTGLPVSVRCDSIPQEPYNFRVLIRWNRRKEGLTVISAGVISALLVSGLLYYDPPGAPVLITALTACTALALHLWNRRYRILERRHIRTGEVIGRQLDKLQSITAELIRERDGLHETVERRTAKLNRALEDLKALDRGKTNFIANISHELRTPLTLLTVPMEEIRSGRYGASLETDNKIFSLMERNILRLRTQINQLLDFTRLDIGAQPFHPLPVDLFSYCRTLTAELHSLAEKKGLSLRVINRTELDSPTVSADISLLESLLLNLLNNALKFTSRGGVSIILEYGDRVVEGIQLTVRDTGIGFPEGEEKRIFERFTQIEENRDRGYEGTGLGLALVDEIVRIHGWRIEAGSVPGEGAEFRVFLPLCEDQPVRRESFSEGLKERAAAGLPSAGPSRREAEPEKESILLVEDNPDMASLLEELLGNDYGLIWYASGAEALRRFGEEGPFSLVICDMMMPGMDGLEFRQSFLKKTGDRELPFVYLTALADSEVRQKALESGALDYIAKPFSGDELRMKVCNLLESRRLRYRQALRDREGSERILKMKELESRESREQHLQEFHISPAEQRVLELLKDGLQDKEIADHLSISPRTVSTHLRNLYKKTGSQNRVELLNRIFS